MGVMTMIDVLAVPKQHQREGSQPPDGRPIDVTGSRKADFSRSRLDDGKRTGSNYRLQESKVISGILQEGN